VIAALKRLRHSKSGVSLLSYPASRPDLNTILLFDC
jgi:hypothetical protein